MAARASGLALSVLIGSLVLTPPAGACISFTKVVDSDTPVPGGTGTFFFLSAPSFDGSIVAFTDTRIIGGRLITAGVYKHVDGALEVVADRNTLIPGSAEAFDHFDAGASVCDGAVLFVGYGASGSEGIYLARDGLAAIADTQTPIPGGSGNFAHFHWMSHDGGTVVFRGESGTGEYAIYRYDGTLSCIVDQNTLIPPYDDEPFAVFMSTAVRGGSVVFYGQAADGSPGGIYRLDGDGLTCVVDDSTEIPEGIGTFDANGLGGVALDVDGGVKFGGSGQEEQHGVYTSVAGQLGKLVDKNSALPGFKHQVTEFGGAGINSGNLAFTVRCCAAPFGISYAVYANFDGAICRIVGDGDEIDGRTVHQANASRRCIAGNHIAQWLSYDNGAAEGIYLAEFRPGDLDDDRDVDLGDLAELLGHYGTKGTRNQGDINGNGRINLADLEILLTYYGVNWPE